MATAIFTPVRTKNVEGDTWGRYKVWYGTLQASAAADTYATGGCVCSFAGIPGIPAFEAPIVVSTWSESVTVDNFVFVYITGTNAGNGKLAIMTTNTVNAGVNAPYVEMTNATAIGAAIFGDSKIRFEARWIAGR
jgi:hypothetical protein